MPCCPRTPMASDRLVPTKLGIIVGAAPEGAAASGVRSVPVGATAEARGAPAPPPRARTAQATTAATAASNPTPATTRPRRRRLPFSGEERPVPAAAALDGVTGVASRGGPSGADSRRPQLGQKAQSRSTVDPQWLHVDGMISP